MRKLLRNLIEIAEMDEIPEQLFRGFKRVNEEARDALRSVIKWALGHREEYKEIIAAMGV